MSPASYLTAPPRVAGRSIARLARNPRVRRCHLRDRGNRATIWAIEAPIEHQDVTTIMGLLGDMEYDIARIRELLEGELGEETEVPEDDA